MKKSRTYLYRFAVMKQDKLKEFSHFYHNPSEELPNYGYLNRRLHPFFAYLPLKDQPYFTEVRDHFDLSKAEEALNLFNGEHNFLAFANRYGVILEGNANKPVYLCSLLSNTQVYSVTKWFEIAQIKPFYCYKKKL